MFIYLLFIIYLIFELFVRKCCYFFGGNMLHFLLLIATASISIAVSSPKVQKFRFIKVSRQ